MTPEPQPRADPRIEQALAELQALIAARYPDATFDVVSREDPPGLRLRATVDIDDPDAVMDVVIDKLYELQVERSLPVAVVPVQPVARIAEALRTHPVRRAPKNLRTILHP